MRNPISQIEAANRLSQVDPELLSHPEYHHDVHRILLDALHAAGMGAASQSMSCSERTLAVTITVLGLIASLSYVNYTDSPFLPGTILMYFSINGYMFQLLCKRLVATIRLHHYASTYKTQKSDIYLFFLRFLVDNLAVLPILALCVPANEHFTSFNYAMLVLAYFVLMGSLDQALQPEFESLFSKEQAQKTARYHQLIADITHAYSQELENFQYTRTLEPHGFLALERLIQQNPISPHLATPFLRALTTIQLTHTTEYYPTWKKISAFSFSMAGLVGCLALTAHLLAKLLQTALHQTAAGLSAWGLSLISTSILSFLSIAGFRTGEERLRDWWQGYRSEAELYSLRCARLGQFLCVGISLSSIDTYIKLAQTFLEESGHATTSALSIIIQCIAGLNMYTINTTGALIILTWLIRQYIYYYPWAMQQPHENEIRVKLMDAINLAFWNESLQQHLLSTANPSEDSTPSYVEFRHSGSSLFSVTSHYLQPGRTLSHNQDLNTPLVHNRTRNDTPIFDCSHV
ncbi:MAG: hypothetical protein A3J38_03610 [Gammaproteobacteria bacterium RIFCSPHIGHO2_12_FULL_45_9]|nr:MAG: hypothetical protein A3J38_03610 [Gammaproteobacteria bacterium RIFCSPHIGHO2_12_FULL_45_9]